MKDFDFDELDRAVSSVLTKKKQSTDPVATDSSVAVPVSQVSPAADASQTSTSSVSTTEPAEPAEPGAVQTPPVALEEVAEPASDETARDDESAQTPLEAHEDNMHSNSNDDLPEVPMVSSLSPAKDEADRRENDSDNTDVPSEQTDQTQSNLEPVESSLTHDDQLHDEKTASDEPHDDNDQMSDEESDSHTENTPEEDSPVHENTSEDRDTADNSDEVTATNTDDSNTSDPSQDVVAPRRGRFMDMVHPSADMKSESKPMGPRSGVTITPSSDFSVAPDDEQNEVGVSTIDATPSITEEVEEPATSDLSLDTETQDEPVDEPGDDAVAIDTTTPFIPDVPVEKRPLNALPADGLGDTSSVSLDEKASVVATGDSGQTPREFAPDVMAVEANETVGETEQSADNTNPDTSNTTSTDVSPATAAAAAEQEPHPVFDASSYQQPLASTKPKSSMMIWGIVVLILFLVGASIGVLYFLYGQQ